MEQVHIVRTDSEGKLIFDDMRREILRLLARENLTMQKLSSILGLSTPTVGHHLNALKRSGLVEIIGTEVEAHGILQKFYSATAQTYIIDSRKLSPSVRRYFMPARIERTRGMLAALSLCSANGYNVSPRLVEIMTDELARHILEAAERRQGLRADSDPEWLIGEIYREALSDLIRARPSMLPHVSMKTIAGLQRD